MAKAAAHFDAQTIALLKVALDEAWDRPSGEAASHNAQDHTRRTYLKIRSRG
jgi:hypothetical protein